MPDQEPRDTSLPVESHHRYLQEFYDALPLKMTGWSHGYRKLLAAYYNEMIPDNATVLEVGCGSGTLLSMLKGKHKTGIDLSPRQIEAARSRLPEATLEVVVAELFRPTQTYDIIILSDTLNQTGDCQLLLERLKEASHPNTRLLINVMNASWRPLMSLVRRMGISARIPAENWLSQNDIRNFLQLSEWDHIRTYSKILVPIAGFLPASLINRWLAPFLAWFNFAIFVVARPGKNFANAQPSLSIVIPARNEAGNIEAAVRRVPQICPKQEWIFVEGGSSDDTWAKLQSLKQLFPEKAITVMQQTKSGKANAVHEGFAQAKGDVLMILDADLTMPPEELPKFYNAIVKGQAEFANGVRLIYPMDNEAMPFLNLCANKFFAVLFTWLIDQPVKDTLCGTKVLTKSNYEKIMANRSHFGDFDPFGDFELLFGASRLNLKITDIPIRYKNRTYGQTNISRWRHGFILLQMAAVGATKLKFI